MAQEGDCAIEIHHLLRRLSVYIREGARKHYAPRTTLGRSEMAIFRLPLCIPLSPGGPHEVVARD